MNNLNLRTSSFQPRKTDARVFFKIKYFFYNYFNFFFLVHEFYFFFNFFFLSILLGFLVFLFLFFFLILIWFSSIFFYVRIVITFDK